MIHLLLPDNEAGRSLAHGLQEGGLAQLVESDDSLLLAPVDKRMRHALDCLEQENLLVHKYDYVWIMRYINEEHVKGTGLFFYSVNSYHEYVTTYMCHQGVAGVSTLSLYYSYGEGRFPNWTFTDTKDATERLRRVNVVQRFIVLFFFGH
jgi:hypothetical protein